MRIVTTSLAFVLMFLLPFVLAGLFLMPHLPPTPRQAVTPFEGAFWTDIGPVLSLVWCSAD